MEEIENQEDTKERLFKEMQQSSNLSQSADVQDLYKDLLNKDKYQKEEKNYAVWR